MDRQITYENLRQFAYSNDKLVKGPIRGIILVFFGLGSTAMFGEPMDVNEGVPYGEQGILYLLPYNNPWCWMNPQAVDFVDEVLDVLFEHYDLPENTPIISTGGSMGGQSALTYMAYAKRTPVACLANCPVCDMVYHYTERFDLPRTIYSALHQTEGSLEEGLKSLSPLHLAERMPKVPYYLFHCSEDKMVNIDRHSKVFAARMEELGHRVVTDYTCGVVHCNLTEAAQKKWKEICIDEINKNAVV